MAVLSGFVGPTSGSTFVEAGGHPKCTPWTAQDLEMEQGISFFLTASDTDVSYHFMVNGFDGSDLPDGGLFGPDEDPLQMNDPGRH